MDTSSPFSSPAESILRGEPTINDQQREQLFDAFHTKNSDELVQHLQSLVLPDDFKKRLYDAKKSMEPTPAPLDKVSAAVDKLAALDPQKLELAEAHPQTFKVFAAAATAPQKEAQGAAGGDSAAPKGKEAAAIAAPAPLTLSPRPDGSPHLPPIPTGHRRVLASDGGIHDVPEENLDKAREIDPLLHVLNP